MGAHFATPARSRPGRRRQAGFLAIALGVGLLAFAFLDEDGTPVRSTGPTIPPSSEPTVLGVTVEPPTTAGAVPATPVSLTVPDDGAPTTAEPRSTTTGEPATTTTEGPVLIPPTVVTNTIPTRPTTTTTTTTEPTTTTESTTTTEATTTTSEGG
ncbi:MAG: hypothetical protein ACO1PW_05495 [Actinomycetota bacterium]